MLGEEGGKFVERNKFHAVVKIHVAGVRNDDQLLRLSGKPVGIFTELSGVSGIARNEKNGTRLVLMFSSANHARADFTSITGLLLGETVALLIN
jgi:hypothetical protein